MGGSLIDVINPYSGDVVGVIPGFDADVVDEACRGAARYAPTAASTPRHVRSEILTRAASLVAERSEEFASVIAAEAGKPLRTARGEVSRAIDTLRLSSQAAVDEDGEMIPMDATTSGAGRLGYTYRVPIGVVAAITPFNFPLNLVAHKLAPAIAAGCPVVLKPAEVTPLTALALVDLLVEAGLPAEWISVVTGFGHDVGAALVANPVPAMISFTGSAEVGWGIRAAAPRKRVALELGSVAPVIVTEDTDPGAVAPLLADAAFGYAGQSCISTQRILVHDDLHDELVNHLVDATGRLVVGDPLDENTDVGPLISDAAARKVMATVEAAVTQGAETVIGGGIERNRVEPTVLVDVGPSFDIHKVEVFGPVVTVEAYTDFKEAIGRVNESDLAIHAGVFTNRLDVALMAAENIDYGGVIVNDVATFRTDQQPYGGVRDSGNSREGPRYAIREMTTERFVSMRGMAS